MITYMYGALDNSEVRLRKYVKYTFILNEIKCHIFKTVLSSGIFK
jgi:hypothetical protein